MLDRVKLSGIRPSKIIKGLVLASLGENGLTHKYIIPHNFIKLSILKKWNGFFKVLDHSKTIHFAFFVHRVAFLTIVVFWHAARCVHCVKWQEK